jgi:hypothetical protein
MHRDGTPRLVQIVAGGPQPGPPGGRFTVLDIADGYSAAELPLFAQRAQVFADRLLRTAPFDLLGPLLNVSRLDRTGGWQFNAHFPEPAGL